MIRQDIVDAIITQLKTITTTNGYNVTVQSTDVTDWMEGNTDTDVDYALEVNDEGADIQKESEAYSKITLRISIKGYVKKEADTAKYTRKLMDDVYKAMYAGQQTWCRTSSYNGLMVVPTGDLMEVFEEEEVIGIFSINFDFRYNSGQWRI